MAITERRASREKTRHRGGLQPAWEVMRALHANLAFSEFGRARAQLELARANIVDAVANATSCAPGARYAGRGEAL